VNDQERLIEGIRRAHQAGNADARGRSALRLRALQQAPAGAPPAATAGPSQARPSAGDLLALSPLPSEPEMQAASADVAAGANRWLGEQLDISGTHYRNLGRMAGLPIDAPAEEDSEAYTQQAFEAAASVAGAGVASLAGKPVSAIAKWLGPGGQQPWAAEGMLAAAGKHVVPPGSPKAASIPGELAKASLAGAAVDVAPEITPGPDVAHEWLENVAAGATGLGYLGMRGTKNLMVRNPTYRAQVMSPAGSSGWATALGAITGLAAAQGLPAVREFISDIWNDLQGVEDVPGPQAGASDVSGPLPPRVPRDRLEEQREIARRLTG
jgi:hypothetical protein